MKKNEVTCLLTPMKKIAKEAHVFLLVTILSVLVVLFIAVKAKTTPDFNKQPILFSYSIFVSAFVFSRFVSSLLYKQSFKKVTKKSDKEYEPLVTCIIPCLNEEKSIGYTIEKCFEAKYPQEKIEVIVVNDGSTDKTGEVVRSLQNKYPNLTLVDWHVNKGKREGMTEGFRRAKGEIVVQLDSDSYIDPQTFPNIIEPFQNPEIGAVCAHGEPQNAGDNIWTKMQSAYYFVSFRILKAGESTFHTVMCCSGCSSAYRKSVVMPILDLWLNEKFLGSRVIWGEDRSLTSWVLKSGYKTIYTTKTLAYTIVPDSFKKLLKQQVRWKKSWIVNAFITGSFIYKKHPFVATVYFFPLVAVSLLTPITVFAALVYSPIVHNMSPIAYLLGIFLLTSITAVYYRILDRKNKYWAYLYLWVLLNVCFLSYLVFYAAVRLQDRNWGTRKGRVEENATKLVSETQAIDGMNN